MKFLIDFVTGVSALAYFMMIAAATKQHFNSDKYPWGMHLISILSLIWCVVLYVHGLCVDPKSSSGCVVADRRGLCAVSLGGAA
jgi:hypothetical protein